MTQSFQEQYNELSFYTLAHQGESFIHQHIVDAHTAQTADTNTRPISILFALAGLYLLVEKNYSGRQVQQAHLQMAKNKQALPSVILPAERGEITVSDVLAKPPGRERDEMIYRWCASVWEANKINRKTIITLTQATLTP
jgi:ABC-type phosphate/phosphonate transport system permease subunit